jgi:hypothetical protein
VQGRIVWNGCSTTPNSTVHDCDPVRSSKGLRTINAAHYRRGALREPHDMQVVALNVLSGRLRLLLGGDSRARTFGISSGRSWKVHTSVARTACSAAVT